MQLTCSCQLLLLHWLGAQHPPVRDRGPLVALMNLLYELLDLCSWSQPRVEPQPRLPPHFIPNRSLAQHCLHLPTPTLGLFLCSQHPASYGDSRGFQVVFLGRQVWAGLSFIPRLPSCATAKQGKPPTNPLQSNTLSIIMVWGACACVFPPELSLCLSLPSFLPSFLHSVGFRSARAHPCRGNPPSVFFERKGLAVIGM